VAAVLGGRGPGVHLAVASKGGLSAPENLTELITVSSSRRASRLRTPKSHAARRTATPARVGWAMQVAAVPAAEEQQRSCSSVASREAPCRGCGETLRARGQRVAASPGPRPPTPRQAVRGHPRVERRPRPRSRGRVRSRAGPAGGRRPAGSRHVQRAEERADRLRRASASAPGTARTQGHSSVLARPASTRRAELPLLHG